MLWGFNIIRAGFTLGCEMILFCLFPNNDLIRFSWFYALQKLHHWPNTWGWYLKFSDYLKISHSTELFKLRVAERFRNYEHQKISERSIPGVKLNLELSKIFQQLKLKNDQKLKFQSIIYHLADLTVSLRSGKLPDGHILWHNLSKLYESLRDLMLNIFLFLSRFLSKNNLSKTHSKISCT